MDSKDFSSTSMAANEDGVVSATAGPAKDAIIAFHAEKFEVCVHVLNQLLQKKDDDPKILHNIAISKYFQDGCSDPKKLLEVLNIAKKWSDELARASCEHADAISMGNKAALGSKGTNNEAHQVSSTNSSPIVYSDEFNTSLTMLNI